MPRFAFLHCESEPIMKRTHRLILNLFSALTVAITLPVDACAETWRFGLIGDTPYSDHERRELPKMLDAMAEQGVEVIVHIGDIKHGKDRCDDPIFIDRFQLFNASRVPFVFVPGDNEWSDCDRISNGAFDPLERLNFLRRLFWKTDHSLGQRTLPLRIQPGAYREHAQFRLGPVLFVTVNVPGGNNFGNKETPSAEYSSRNPQVLAWIRDGFARAQQEKLPGIALLFQADPDFKRFGQGLGNRAYRDMMELIREETLRFPGQVLVVHGDTHISRIDQPLRDSNGQIVPNFTRVETFGYPLMGWTRGVIDPGDPRLFRFEANPWSGKGGQ